MNFDRNSIADALLKRFSVAVPPLRGYANRPAQRPSSFSGDGRIGAVMLMLFSNENNETEFILTRRTGSLRHHAGQISLPGGRQDPGETLKETAIRETVEEIGVQARHLDILGRLNPCYIPPSDFTVHPFISWHAGRPEFQMAEEEVSEILTVRVADLIDLKNVRFGPIESEVPGVEAGYFAFGQEQIWGATAVILHEFFTRIAGETR